MVVLKMRKSDGFRAASTRLDGWWAGKGGETIDRDDNTNENANTNTIHQPKLVESGRAPETIVGESDMDLATKSSDGLQLAFYDHVPSTMGDGYIGGRQTASTPTTNYVELTDDVEKAKY